MGSKTILIYYEQIGYGGVDTHMAHLINNWPSLEDRITVLTNSDNEGLSFLRTGIVRDNVNIETFELMPRFTNQLFFAKIFRFFWHKTLYFSFYFLKILRLKKPDILISDNGGYPGGITCFLAVIIGKLYKSKMSVGLIVHHAPDSAKNFIRIYADSLSFFIKYLKIHLITVSSASKKTLQAYTPLRNFKVIYNGLESFSRESEPIDLRKNYSIDDSRLILGMMGPIEARKGHALLLNVFGISELLRSKAYILFVGKGSGQIEKSLREMVYSVNLSKFVTFTGFLPGNPLDVIKQFDILVMPTIDFEGFGYSMAEAMTQGIPVVASRVGAIPEVIKDGQSGILVDPKDINQLKVALEELVVNPKYREEIGLEGKRRIESNFSAKQMAQEYYNLLVSNLDN